MKNAKSIGRPLSGHFKLSKNICLSTKEEKESVAAIPYSSAVGSLIYVMLCTQSCIALAVRIVSRFFINSSKDH